MRLLVTTQAVDQNDPILGFFHRWLLEFARQFDSVQVICLREGTHSLPPNVTIHCLGKTSMELATPLQKLGYIVRFYTRLFSVRTKYDAVFVHMNPEYMALAGWYWRLTNTPAVLFYTHKHVGLVLRIAHVWARSIVTAAAGSFRIDSKKVLALGHGIDTDFFAPTIPRTRSDVLHAAYAGRIAPAKHTHELLFGLQKAHERKVKVVLDHYGDSIPRDEAYVVAARALAEPLVKERVLVLHGGVTQETIVAAYQTADCVVNTTPAGSFDKAVLEGMATGLPAIVCNESFFDAVPADLRFDLQNAYSLAAALAYCSDLDEAARKKIGDESRAWVVEHHSLKCLVTKLKEILS